jgi:hypothetical protein
MDSSEIARSRLLTERKVHQLADKIEKSLLMKVDPERGVTIGLLDSFLKKACGGYNSYYKGTFTADMIPKNLTLQNRFQLVVNTSRSDESLSKVGHFIVIEGHPRFITFIDPFGLPCTQNDIQTFINSCNRRSYHSTTPIQHPSSMFCPLYCALFIIYYHVNPSWQMSFSKVDTSVNEENCMRQLNRLLRDPKWVIK